MNKIFTLLAAATMAMSANATVLWEGQVVMGAWEGQLSLDFETPENWTPAVQSALADVEAGYQLVFTYKDVTLGGEAPGQIQIDAKVGPTWKWTELILEDLIGDTYTYTFTDEPIEGFDYTDVETIPERGFFVKGQNATLVKVELLPPGGQEFTETTTDIWTGELALGNWTGELNLCNDGENPNWTEAADKAFTNLKKGDKIAITTTGAIDGSQVGIYTKVGATWDWTEVVPYANLTNNSYTYKVTDDFLGETDYTILEVLSERGIIIKGHDATVVKVSIITKDGQGGGDDPITPDVPATGAIVWEGDQSIQTWDDMFEYKNVPENTQWNDDVMGAITEGTKIVFHYGDMTGTSEEPAQIQFVSFTPDDKWTWTEIVKFADITGTTYTYTVEDAPVGTSDFTDVEMLSQRGFALKGQHANLKKVEVINPGAGVENVAVDNKIDFDAPVEIYTIDGRRVNEMTQGRIYIVRQGNKVVKLAK